MNELSCPDVTVTEGRFEPVPGKSAEVIRLHSRSFAVASLLLPSGVREDVQKLYAWCRWCDDAVDDAVSKKQATERLAMLRDDVRRIYRGERPADRASIWLAELVAKYQIESELPMRLLDGMGRDLALGQIETERELLDYCFHAAGVVGLMLCRVFGVTDPRAARHAKALGIAMQLTNIARDVREDWERGRCYLPKCRFGPCGFDESPTDVQIRPSLDRVLALADDYYEVGDAGVRYLPSEVRTAVRVASAVYREIGLEIRRRQLGVMDGRVIVPKSRFAIAALRAWSRGAARDAQESIGLLFDGRIRNFSNSETLKMNDAKYLAYLGISLTAFVGSGLFLLMMLNPKDASYSQLPMAYAIGCLAVGVAANLLAKRAERETGVPAEPWQGDADGDR